MTLSNDIVVYSAAWISPGQPKTNAKTAQLLFIDLVTASAIHRPLAPTNRHSFQFLAKSGQTTYCPKYQVLDLLCIPSVQ